MKGWEIPYLLGHGHVYACVRYREIIILHILALFYILSMHVETSPDSAARLSHGHCIHWQAHADGLEGPIWGVWFYRKASTRGPGKDVSNCTFCHCGASRIHAS